MVLAYANQGVTDVQYWTGASGYAYTQNVPEPSSLFLLPCGTGCLVWGVRRRTRRS